MADPAVEDAATAAAAERRRLADLLESRVAASLNLLLAQANVYEQALAAHPTAYMAVSVLSSLARQALQQVRDLQAGLHPAVLETLGLEPALEALAAQAMRAHGLQVALSLERLPGRPPPPVELALYRLAQEALERAVGPAHASQMTVQLIQRGGQLRLGLSDNGAAAADWAGLRAACRRIEQLGGAVEVGAGGPGGLGLTATLAVAPPVELTGREMEVLRRLAGGLSNKEIAQALSVSPRTVNFHLDNVYTKLGVHSRTEAVVYALWQGWVSRPE